MNPSVRTGETGRVRDDRREDFVDVQRGRYRLPDLTERPQFVHAILQFLEQPGVLDRDHRLVRERLQQRDLLVGVRLLLEAMDRQNPDGPTIAHEWCCHLGPDPGKGERLMRVGELRDDGGFHVRDVDGALI